MNKLNNFILADGGASSEQVGSNLASIANTIQQYINIVLGAFAGILAIVIIIVAAVSFFKAGKTDNEEVRQTQLKRVKWLGIFLVAALILWALTPLMIALIKNFAVIKAS